MKAIGIIPARGGSKGIPNKNIYPLVGKPLLEYTIEAALKSSLDRVVVSTDSKKIAAVATNLGAEVVERPEELSRDTAPTLPVLHHVLETIGGHFDFVVTLQPTSPFRRADHIDKALDLIQADETVDSLVSVMQVPHNMSPQSIMKIDGGVLVDYLFQAERVLRRQDKEIYYARNGAAIYITRESQIDKYIFGGRILPFEMDWKSSIDIDTHDDLVLAEAILIQNKKNEKNI